MDEYEHDNIRGKLRGLQQYESFSPFCRIFYDLIEQWIVRADAEKLALAQVFTEFLDVEMRRHASIRKLMRSGSITLLDLVEISQELRKDVEDIFVRMALLEEASPVSRVVANLIRAECSYHLGETDQVISSLQRSISGGCDHQIVFLALGFNLYCRAIKIFTEHGAEPDKLIVSDPSKFAMACEEAVDAFKQGIRGGRSPYDSRLYWWIGSVCEIVQKKSDAIVAYRRAMELDPSSFGEEGMRKIADLSPSAKDAISEREKIRLAGLPEISEEDLRKGAEWLRELRSVDDLLDEQ